MNVESTGSTGTRTAAYLRCHAYDEWQMKCHRDALHQYAEQLGLPEPALYLDNGRPSSGPLPALDRLLRDVTCGAYDVVLVPGAFVFSLSDTDARDIVRRITSADCRVMHLPSPREFSRALERQAVHV